MKNNCYISLTKNDYLEVLACGERVYRLYMDVLKQELNNLNIADINSVQAYILLNIGNRTITVGEIMSRGYYIGSNASYNIKKMIANKYLTQSSSDHDKRAVHLSLTNRGLELCEKMNKIFDKHMDALKRAVGGKTDFDKGVTILKKIENFWQDALLRRV